MLKHVWKDQPAKVLENGVDEDVLLPSPLLDTSSYGDVNVAAAANPRNVAMCGQSYRAPVLLVANLEVLNVLDSICPRVGGVHIGALERKFAATSPKRAGAKLLKALAASAGTFGDVAAQSVLDEDQEKRRVALESTDDSTKMDDSDPFIVELDPALVGEGTYMQRKFADEDARVILLNALSLVKAGVNQCEYGTSPDHTTPGAPDVAAESATVIQIVSSLDPKTDVAPVTHFVVRQLIPGLLGGAYEFQLDDESVYRPIPTGTYAADSPTMLWARYWLSAIDHRLIELYLRDKFNISESDALTYCVDPDGAAPVAVSQTAFESATLADSREGLESIAFWTGKDPTVISSFYNEMKNPARPSWLDVVSVPCDVTPLEQRSTYVAGQTSSVRRPIFIVKEGVEAVKLLAPRYKDSYPKAASMRLATSLLPWAERSLEEQATGVKLSAFRPTYAPPEDSDPSHFDGRAIEVKVGTTEIIPNLESDRSGPYLLRGQSSSLALSTATSEAVGCKKLLARLVSYWISACGFNEAGAATAAAPFNSSAYDVQLDATIGLIDLGDNRVALIHPAESGFMYAHVQSGPEDSEPNTDATFRYKYKLKPDDPSDQTCIMSTNPLRIHLGVYNTQHNEDEVGMYSVIDEASFELSSWAELAVADVLDAQNLTRDSIEYGSKDQAQGKAEYKRPDGDVRHWWDKFFKWLSENMWFLFVLVLVLVLLSSKEGGGETTLVISTSTGNPPTQPQPSSVNTGAVESRSPQNISNAPSPSQSGQTGWDVI